MAMLRLWRLSPEQQEGFREGHVLLVSRVQVQREAGGGGGGGGCSGGAGRRLHGTEWELQPNGRIRWAAGHGCARTLPEGSLRYDGGVRAWFRLFNCPCCIISCTCARRTRRVQCVHVPSQMPGALQ